MSSEKKISSEKSKAIHVKTPIEPITNELKTKSKSKSKKSAESKADTKTDTKKDIKTDIKLETNTEIIQTENKKKNKKSNISNDLTSDGSHKSNKIESDHESDHESKHESDHESKKKTLKKGKKTLTVDDLMLKFNPDEEKKKDEEEDILKKKNKRLGIKPIDPTYQIIWELYKKQQAADWKPEAIDFSDDRHDFKKLDKNIHHFIKMVLAFFYGADTIVIINIKEKFSKITIKEAEVAYGYQQMMENVHGEVYADMLINIIEDSKECEDLTNAFETINSIKMMNEWAQKWIDSDRRIAFSIVAFTIFEGIMFSGAFVAIYWLKKILGEDKMKGLSQSNNYIAKDEGMHTNFGCIMYSYIKHKLTQEELSVMMIDAVDIAKKFTQDAIRVDLIGMNSKLMGAYLEYVADRLAVYLGHEKIFNTPNPDQFQFMDTIGFLNKDNFFERRSTEYQKAYNNKNRADWKFKRLDKY